MNGSGCSWEVEGRKPGPGQDNSVLDPRGLQLLAGPLVWTLPLARTVGAEPRLAVPTLRLRARAGSGCSGPWAGEWSPIRSSFNI